jgi:hypothetical protein
LGRRRRGGVAERLGIDAIWVRVLFFVSTVVAGVGLPVYVIAWLLMRRADGRPRRLRTGRGAIEVGAGAGLLVLAALLALRATGLSWFSDALIWPLVLVIAGAALIWRTSQSSPRAPQLDGPAVALKPRAAALPEPEPEPAERAAWAAASSRAPAWASC